MSSIQLLSVLTFSQSDIKHSRTLQGNLYPENIFIAQKTKEWRNSRSSMVTGHFLTEYREFNNPPLFNADSNSQMSPADALQASQKLLFTDRCFSGYHPLSHCEHMHLWMSFTLLRDSPRPVLRSPVSTELFKSTLYLYSSAGVYVEWISQLRKCLGAATFDLLNTSKTEKCLGHRILKCKRTEGKYYILGLPIIAIMFHTVDFYGIEKLSLRSQIVY